MTGKVFGIPLALIILVLAIGAIVLIPVFVLHNVEMRRLEEINLRNLECVSRVDSRPVQIVEPTKTPTPTEEPTKEPTRRPTPTDAPSANEE